MTAPRQVLPGTTYLVTRRCFQRQFLLRPSATTNEIFTYVLALAARRYGIRVHAFCVMSNHFHLVVTDPDARLPAFEQYLDALVARAMNATLGRWESFWAPASYSAVALQSPADVVAKTAYVLANPVSAGLVRRGRDWPGVWSSPESIGGSALVAHRPTKFFRPGGYLPDAVELALEAPPGFASADDFRSGVEAEVRDVEAVAGRTSRSRGRRVLGRMRALTQAPWGRPTAGEQRRGMNPRVAAQDKWKRLEALTRLLEFVHDYRVALAALRGGVRDALFPAGTYLLRVQHGVCCAALP